MTIEVNKPVKPGNEEDFLSRWSREKNNARQLAIEEKSNNTLLSIEPAIESEVKPLLTDADMPSLESLGDDSDYSGFLSPRVSEALRNQALRKLFHSTVFNVCDGLDDYDEDFTSFEKLGDIITADMKHQVEMEAQRIKQLAEQELTEEEKHEEIESDTNDTIQQGNSAGDAHASADNVEEEQT